MELTEKFGNVEINLWSDVGDGEGSVKGWQKSLLEENNFNRNAKKKIQKKGNSRKEKKSEEKGKRENFWTIFWQRNFIPGQFVYRGEGSANGWQIRLKL